MRLLVGIGRTGKVVASVGGTGFLLVYSRVFTE